MPKSLSSAHVWQLINSLALGTFKWNFIYVIFNLILVTDGRGIYCEIVLRKMSSDLDPTSLGHNELRSPAMCILKPTIQLFIRCPTIPGY